MKSRKRKRSIQTGIATIDCDLLRIQRDVLGWTQDDLAHKACINKRALQKIEANGRARYQTVENIDRAMHEAFKGKPECTYQSVRVMQATTEGASNNTALLPNNCLQSELLPGSGPATAAIASSDAVNSSDGLLVQRTQPNRDTPAGPTSGEAEFLQFGSAVGSPRAQVDERFPADVRADLDMLSACLTPITSDIRIRELLSRGFCGRQWMFDAVENWAHNKEHNSRILWIQGAPGVGKSAFAAQLAHRRQELVIAAHFFEWDKAEHRNLRRVICSLAYQLATRLPQYRMRLLALPEIGELDKKEASELFDCLLANPLHLANGSGRERHLIVIDALDEGSQSGKNSLVDMLVGGAKRLPDWLGLVVTSRPEFEVTAPLQELKPLVLDAQSDPNRTDIRAHLRNELGASLQNRANAGHLVELILERSEGVFMYIEHFCEAIRLNDLSLDNPGQFPQGLGGVFFKYFRRQFPDVKEFRTEVRPVLRAILAAREPLPLKTVQTLFSWQEDELRDFARPLASLFPVTIDAGREVIRPYHKSLPDWLTDAMKAGDYFVSQKEGHRLLADRGYQQFERAPRTMHDYFLAWLPSHLREIGDGERLADLLKNPAYLMRRLEAAFSFVDGYEYTVPQRVLDIRDAVTELTKAAVPDLRDPDQRAVETERAVLLYKCHEYLKTAGLSHEAKESLQAALDRREQLANSAVTAPDRQLHLGAMIWCHLGFCVSAGISEPEKAEHLKLGESILQQVEAIDDGSPSSADLVARLQGIVWCTLAVQRRDKRIPFLKNAIDAYLRARRTSLDDRALQYSLAAAARDLAFALVEHGELQAAASHLSEAELVLADLMKCRPENLFYVRLDAHLRRIRSRLLLREGKRKAAITEMGEACDRIGEACVTIKNTLVQREAAEFRRELEKLRSPS